MCIKCNEKVKIAYDFQQLCLQSHQFISACITATQMVQEPVKVEKEETDEIIIPPEDIHLHQRIPKHFSEVIKEEAVSEDNKSKDDDLRNNQSAKLSKHSAEDVNAVIQKFRAKFLVKRDCLHCSFTTKNCRVLSLHMRRVHR